ncbi:hypothetical protein [Streptomyces sedi]|uniref:DUF4760 domain-containing protein n=1 Tax=Streptomyces sedi TaxID=555059 RepID=A0A5C4UWD1_9ACTN|nr:hypothetical protein [Streptomyces sedi]TNM27951.1 hypothetical protein FH715_19370 [Streptomyces sedi]
MSLVTWVSAGVALGSAALTGVLGYWAQRRLRGAEERSLMATYGMSLAWAAYDLQSRFFNILRGHQIDQEPGTSNGFVEAFLRRGSERERAYVRRSTVFVIAEYLGWVEILRRDVRFLDLGPSRTNREVMTRIFAVDKAFNRTKDSDAFRLFRGHQRAIGELMIHPEGGPGERRCLGYAEFSARLDDDAEFRRWFDGLLADVDGLVGGTGPAVERLTAIQHALVELIELLDPKAQRLPRFRDRFRTGPNAGG